MSYTSYSFALFVILTVCVYYIVRKKWQWVVLLVASMFFYLCAGPALSIYLLLFCLATWYGAKRIGRRKSGMQVSEKMHLGCQKVPFYKPKGHIAQKRKPPTK